MVFLDDTRFSNLTITDATDQVRLHSTPAGMGFFGPPPRIRWTGLQCLPGRRFTHKENTDRNAGSSSCHIQPLTEASFYFLPSLKRKQKNIYLTAPL